MVIKHFPRFKVPICKMLLNSAMRIIIREGGTFCRIPRKQSENVKNLHYFSMLLTAESLVQKEEKKPRY